MRAIRAATIAMWRCAGRSLIGVLGALHLKQHPAFAESTLLSSTAGASSLSKSDARLSSTSNTASSTVGQSAQLNQSNERQQAEASDSHHRAAIWPQKLERGTHFAVLNGSDGSASSLSSVMAAMQTADVVFLGEYHDDPVAHALQLELLKRVTRELGYQLGQPSGPSDGGNSNSRSPADHCLQQQQQQHQDEASTRQGADPPSQQQQQRQQRQQQQPPVRPLVLSFEMFERDVQTVLDEYLKGTITLRDLLHDSRPWPNYIRDYGPLVEYCKHHNIPVLAANAPRRYVSLVGKRGRAALDELSQGSKVYLAPLPYAQPSTRYIDKVHSTMKQAAEDMQQHRQQLQQQQAMLEQQSRQPKAQHQDGTTTSSSSTSSSSERLTSIESKAGRNKRQQIAVAATAAAAAAEAAESDAAMDKMPNEPSAAAAVVGAALEVDPSGACPYIGFNVSSNFTDAQVLWDATMAHSIAQQLVQHTATGLSTPMPADIATKNRLAMNKSGQNNMDLQPAAAIAVRASKPLLVHICGKFHCEEGLGIPEHLARYAPGIRMLCIVFVPRDSVQMTAEEFNESGLKGLGDFVVLTDARLPRSFDSVHRL